MIDQNLYNNLIGIKRVTEQCLKRDKEIIKIIRNMIKTKHLSFSDSNRLQELLLKQTGKKWVQKK